MSVNSTSVRAVLSSNLNALAFIAGLSLFALSLAAYSARLSGVITGGLLMLLAAWPYVRAVGRG